MIVTSDSKGMGHHAELFARSHSLKYVPLPHSVNHTDIYQLGVYSEAEYRNIIDRKSGRAVLHWCGRDAFMYEDRMRRGKWGAYKPWPDFIEHYAQSERQIEVLARFGILAKKMLRFNDKRGNYPLTVLPKNFSVLIFVPIDREKDLFFDQLYALIKKSVDISFTLLGFSRVAKVLRTLAFSDYHKIFQKLPNTRLVYPISLLDQPESYRRLLKEHSCLLRFKKTEGFSQMMMQMFLLGRFVVSNIEQEHVKTVDPYDVEQTRDLLLRLKQETQADQQASCFYHARSDINNFDFIPK